ncbi:MAG: CHAD domain-containing protein [Sandaracinaceae bacterium]
MTSTLLQTPVEEGVRRLALAFLERASDGFARLDDPGDAEALHDLRVGLRRLRACLRAYRPIVEDAIGRKLRRQLRKTASLTGPARDAEVQLDWIERQRRTLAPSEAAGAAWLAGRLEKRKAEAYAHVREALPARFGKLEARLRGRLSRYTVRVEVGALRPPMTFGALAAVTIREHAATLSKELRKVRSIDDEAKAHEARIHGKRLRYLLDAFKGEIEGVDTAISHLKSLQDLLGELNDLHNLTATVAAAVEQAAVARAREVREAAVAAEARAALDRVLEEDERPGLLALLRRIHARRDVVFRELLDGWLGSEGRLVTLETHVHAATQDLERAADPQGHVEIERKYLLRSLPSACVGRRAAEIEQGWLPGAVLQERVRRIREPDGEERFVRTVKRGEGVVRLQLEESCPEPLFRSLWPLTEGRRVRKRRYAIEDGGLTWEIDAFQDRELFLAEVELPQEDAKVDVPEWLAPHVLREVTGEAQYVNRRLAK